jgi:hypothetical protein
VVVVSGGGGGGYDDGDGGDGGGGGGSLGLRRSLCAQVNMEYIFGLCSQLHHGTREKTRVEQY